MSIIDNYQSAFDKAVEHFRQDIATLKTGRANPAVLIILRLRPMAFGLRLVSCLLLPCRRRAAL